MNSSAMVALWWYFDANRLLAPWYHSLGQSFSGVVSPWSRSPTSCSTTSFQDSFFGLEVPLGRETGTRGITRPGVGSFCELMRMDIVVGSCCDVVQVDSAAVGIWLTGLGESSRSTVARAPPIGGVVYGGGVVRDSEAHSETSA